MPTVLREGPYCIGFYSTDGGEPRHVHVQRDRRVAKYWLAPTRLAKNRGFAGHELTRIRRIVERHEDRLIEAWNDYFGP
jgi:hypothetical protein